MIERSLHQSNTCNSVMVWDAKKAQVQNNDIWNSASEFIKCNPYLILHPNCRLHQKNITIFMTLYYMGETQRASTPETSRPVVRRWWQHRYSKHTTNWQYFQQWFKAPELHTTRHKNHNQQQKHRLQATIWLICSTFHELNTCKDMACGINQGEEQWKGLER